MLKTEPLKTRRNKAHYGDRVVIDGIPMTIRHRARRDLSHLRWGKAVCGAE